MAIDLYCCPGKTIVTDKSHRDDILKRRGMPLRFLLPSTSYPKFTANQN